MALKAGTAILGVAVGGGVAGGTTALLRALATNATLVKYSSLIGLGAGAAVGGVLAAVPKTRDLGWVALISSGVTNAPQVVSDLIMLPSSKTQDAKAAEGVSRLAAGDAKGAAAAFAEAFGVVTVERVERALSRGLVGVTTAVPATGQNISAAHGNGAPGVEVLGNSGYSTAFGALPIAGIN